MKQNKLNNPIVHVISNNMSPINARTVDSFFFSRSTIENDKKSLEEQNRKKHKIQ